MSKVVLSPSTHAHELCTLLLKVVRNNSICIHKVIINLVKCLTHDVKWNSQKNVHVIMIVKHFNHVDKYSSKVKNAQALFIINHTMMKHMLLVLFLSCSCCSTHKHITVQPSQTYYEVCSSLECKVSCERPKTYVQGSYLRRVWIVNQNRRLVLKSN